jgi:GTP-binding protein
MSEIFKNTNHIINLAIIAHVDHGKTTLIDSILKQTGAYRENQQIIERVMDSNELEKERGITMLAKCTTVRWGNHKINIVDTPGHADFGGEVERILDIIDGVVLLVDAAEGPLPQTKFVLTKALNRNLKPIVVVNKIDRADARPQEVLNEIFELFIAIGATEEQLDFPIIYASGRAGWASLDSDNSLLKDYVSNQTQSGGGNIVIDLQKKIGLAPLLDAIINTIPPVQANTNKPFTMLVTILEADPYLGRLLIGKISTGIAILNMPVKSLDLNGTQIEVGKIIKILQCDGVERISVDTATAGDICVIAGLKKTTVTNTICAMEVAEPIKTNPIDPSTISIVFSVNNSPFAGKEGKKCTSRLIGERLAQEIEKNIALSIAKSNNNDSFVVSGRGELQLGILIETMRREGFEITIGRPQVILKSDENNKQLEPIEEVVVDVDEEFSGSVIEKLSLRKGIMQNMFQTGTGKLRLIFFAPTRGLIGYHSEFLTDTRGTGVMNRIFKCYEPHKGEILGRKNGSLISMADGIATAYSIFNLEDRGVMFISPGEKVYSGMIIGEHTKDNDLEINVIKEKKLTNVRAAGKDDAIKCQTPRRFSLEAAIAYIQDDEVIEVTPENIRLRKKHLNPHDRK